MVNTATTIAVFIFVIALTINVVLAGESPSPVSLKDKDISPEIIKTLPHRDCSTPETAFLGFLRSSVEGNLSDYVFYLTPAAMKTKVGVERDSEISDARVRSFAEGMRKSAFEQLRLESFQVTSEMAPTQILAIVSSVRGKIRGRERLDIALIQTNGQWKFSAVNVSVVNSEPADK